MAKVPADDPGLALAVAFCNTYDLLGDPVDQLTIERLRRIGRDHHRPDLVAQLREVDLPALRRLRETLYAVFAAERASDKASALNAVLDRHGARARLAGDDEPYLSAVGGPAAVDGFAVTLAGGLARALADGGTARMRLCAADPCRCVYVDRTRANRQRYCCELCNDRMASAAYRRRQG
jgi:predicted RNA-binding Zn ribbon-like protein